MSCGCNKKNVLEPNCDFQDKIMPDCFDKARIISLLTTQLLVTPNKIELDPNLWYNYIPTPVLTTNALYTNYIGGGPVNPAFVGPANTCPNLVGSKACIKTIDCNSLGSNGLPKFKHEGVKVTDVNEELTISRMRRVLFPSLEQRYRDTDFLNTEMLDACLGDINARWLLNATPQGEEAWKDPNLACRDPNGVWRQKLEAYSVLQENNPCTNVTAMYNESVKPVTQVKIVTPQPVVMNTEIKPVKSVSFNDTPQVKIISADGPNTKYTTISTSANNSVLKDPYETVSSINPVSPYEKLTPNRANMYQNALDLRRQGLIPGAVDNGYGLTTREKYSVGDFPPGVDAVKLQGVPYSNVGQVTTQGVPINFSNPTANVSTTPSITNSLNGAGNLKTGPRGLEYEPLTAAVNPCYEFPSYTVIANFEEGCNRFMINYVFYRDEFSAFQRTAYLDYDVIAPLVNNLARKLLNEPSLTNNERIALLMGSDCIAGSNRPSDSQVISAFVIWLYSYIGFVGATRWCTDVAGQTWIPIAGFDISMYETFFDQDISYNVNYMLNYKFLLYADVVLETVYMVLPPEYHRWCSMAAGSGWFSLLYEDEDLEVDSMYRHLHIIVSLICQNTWNIRYGLTNQVLKTFGMDERIKALEFKVGLLEGLGVETYKNNYCPTPMAPPVYGPVNLSTMTGNCDPCHQGICRR